MDSAANLFRACSQSMICEVMAVTSSSWLPGLRVKEMHAALRRCHASKHSC